MKYSVKLQGECRTYAALYNTAWHLLDHAKRYQEGSLLQLQASAVFCAFTFEAYLNHVGGREIAYWNEIQRIPFPSKLKVISVHLGVKINKSKPPFKSIDELFPLRNKLAHGRTVDIDDPKYDNETDSLPSYDSAFHAMEWENLTTEKVERYFADLKDAVEMIDKARKSPDPLLWNQGGRSRMVGPGKTTAKK